MEEKRNVPKLRFPGFTDPWEQRRLGELLTYEQPQPYIVESTEYSGNPGTPVLTAGQRFILGYTDEEYGIKIASEDSPVVIFDDFTTSSHFVEFPFKVKSSAMKLLSPRDKEDDFRFIFHTLGKINYTPQGHERHWISKFSKFSVPVPGKIEQEKIGSLFQKLDSLITLHQRKLDHAKELKKGLLQKMFPKEGASVPELRFPGFTDPWEQRRLGELLTYEQPQPYIVESTEYSGNPGTPVLTAGQRFILGYTDEEYGIKIASEDSPVVIFDDFTTSSHFVEFPFKVKSSAMKLLSPRDKEDDFRFIFHTLGKINYTPQGHERHWISKFSKFSVPVPGKIEQEKIGSLFQKLDSLITLHQRQLDHIKELKKGLLQQMFV